ncbi:Retrovirus-related Pol polyprotein from type-1 retrotransposable element R1 [Araneus ventricosus]|uniref:Retrovirus-related Pol polyprotein from type-1 retrotransposable element R1 n=1 Tax=Araneus ventricosus TaxID=182803 RepID=A0A4Y2NHF5_ARAVE|nr:Retrovirus-related Pol polyprotein from type-1 retrotransposable element R1 [Araneus ventricosus]
MLVRSRSTRSRTSHDDAERSPTWPTRSASRELGIARTTVHRENSTGGCLCETDTGIERRRLTYLTYGDIVKEAYASNPSYFRCFLNSCLAKGYFPRRWREAQVVTTRRSTTDPSAYRPICLLDAMGKVLDKLITQRVLFHLLSHNLIHPNQFGFLPGKSAPGAILQLKSWITEARQEGKHSVIISLDVKSAFSRVWWPMVLHTLKHLNCPSNIFKLTSSFLDKRKVFLKYDGTSISKEYTIVCPQGSNSGPLYWLLIANGALQTEFEEDVRLLAYADDFYLFVKATGKHTIQAKATRTLEQLDLWSKKVKISFAHEKTRLIPFGKKGKHKHPPYCRFAGNPIKLYRNMKILGVILDDGLNGIPHIKQTGSKVLQILNRLTIAKYQRGLSGKVVKLLYKRALERILVYAAPSWWMGSQAQKQKISSIQRQALLAISGAFRTTSTVALQVCCGVEPIDLVLDMEVAWYKIRKTREDVSLFGNHIQGSSMKTSTNDWRHPGSLTPVHWTLRSQRSQYTPMGRK